MIPNPLPRKMFEGSETENVQHVMAVAVPKASAGAMGSALAEMAKAQRPLLVIGSQAVVLATQADALADAVARLGDRKSVV